MDISPAFQKLFGIRPDGLRVKIYKEILAMNPATGDVVRASDGRDYKVGWTVRTPPPEDKAVQWGQPAHFTVATNLAHGG